MASTASPATAAGVSVCASDALFLTALRGAGAGGHSLDPYEFTNNSNQPCTLTGYPGVSVINAQGQVVQHPAIEVPGPGTTTPYPVRTITLSSGGHADFMLSSVDTTPNPDCVTAYHGSTLRVYPPGNTVPIELPFAGSFCDLTVGPVHS
jgi:hypothetical protein